MSSQRISRRGFLGHAALAGAAAAVVQAPQFVRGGRWFESASAQTADLLHDTYNGLLAFVVPGNDPYSAHQGVSAPEDGGVDAGASDALIATIHDLKDQRLFGIRQPRERRRKPAAGSRPAPGRSAERRRCPRSAG